MIEAFRCDRLKPSFPEKRLPTAIQDGRPGIFDKKIHAAGWAGYLCQQHRAKKKRHWWGEGGIYHLYGRNVMYLHMIVSRAEVTCRNTVYMAPCSFTPCLASTPLNLFAGQCCRTSVLSSEPGLGSCDISTSWSVTLARLVQRP